MPPRNTQRDSSARLNPRSACSSLALAIARRHRRSPSACPQRKPLEWKPAEQALLRVDDHPVSEWNLYQADKKNNRLLLQMNARFLLVDVTESPDLRARSRPKSSTKAHDLRLGSRRPSRQAAGNSRLAGERRRTAPTASARAWSRKITSWTCRFPTRWTCARSTDGAIWMDRGTTADD